jgi:hypothetical protein
MQSFRLMIFSFRFRLLYQGQTSLCYKTFQLGFGTKLILLITHSDLIRVIIYQQGHLHSSFKCCHPHFLCILLIHMLDLCLNLATRIGIEFSYPSKQVHHRIVTQ